MGGTEYFRNVSITLGDVQGATGIDPRLRIELKIHAHGFAPGTAAMILPTCLVQGAATALELGQAETIIVKLGYPAQADVHSTVTLTEYAQWRLTPTAVESIERTRAGGSLTLSVTPKLVLLNHGNSLEAIAPRPAGRAGPNVDPHCPIWHVGQQHLTVQAPAWAHQVLTPWQQAAALTIVVELPTDTATDDHRTVIQNLTDAQQRLDAGDWKGSVRASRDAIEVLRRMHPERISAEKRGRTIDEREAAILDAELSVINALFSYGSATHPDPHLRGIAWTREHAKLAIAVASAIAQRVFSTA